MEDKRVGILEVNKPAVPPVGDQTSSTGPPPPPVNSTTTTYSGPEKETSGTQTNEGERVTIIGIHNPSRIGVVVYKPIRITCPRCQKLVRTKVRYRSGTLTHLYALLLCPLALCCCPYVIRRCKVAHHYCPLCGTYLGSFDSHLRC